MKATFVEMPAFARWRAHYLDDVAFSRLQHALMENPETGDVMEGAGGLRILYFRWEAGAQFWMFMIYDKNEVADMTRAERSMFRQAIKAELIGRSN